MIETASLEILFNYGALGITAVYLFLQNNKLQQREDRLVEKLTAVIKQNTIAMIKVYELMHEIKEEKKCQMRNKQ